MIVECSNIPSILSECFFTAKPHRKLQLSFGVRLRFLGSAAVCHVGMHAKRILFISYPHLFSLSCFIYKVGLGVGAQVCVYLDSATTTTRTKARTTTTTTTNNNNNNEEEEKKNNNNKKWEFLLLAFVIMIIV